MHESGMIRGLLQKMQSVLCEHGGQKIQSATVWLGALSQISAEHFREHFESETVGTVAEGCKLHIEVSDDLFHPNTQNILLKSVDIDVGAS